MLAVESGEIEGYPTAPVDALKRRHAKQIADGKFRLLLQFGQAPSRDFPDVPYALDLTKTAVERTLLEVAQGPLGVGYAYMLGPGIRRIDRPPCARLSKPRFGTRIFSPS